MIPASLLRSLVLAPFLALFLASASGQAGGQGAAAYGYTAREADASGVICYRSRYYDPALGRYTQRDRIGLAGGLNDYAYVDADPIDGVDPTGRQASANGPSRSAALGSLLDLISPGEAAAETLQGEQVVYRLSPPGSGTPDNLIQYLGLSGDAGEAVQIRSRLRRSEAQLPDRFMTTYPSLEYALNAARSLGSRGPVYEVLLPRGLEIRTYGQGAHLHIAVPDPILDPFLAGRIDLQSIGRVGKTRLFSIRYTPNEAFQPQGPIHVSSVNLRFPGSGAYKFLSNLETVWKSWLAESQRGGVGGGGALSIDDGLSAAAFQHGLSIADSVARPLPTTIWNLH